MSRIYEDLYEAAASNLDRANTALAVDDNPELAFACAIGAFAILRFLSGETAEDRVDQQLRERAFAMLPEAMSLSKRARGAMREHLTRASLQNPAVSPYVESRRVRGSGVMDRVFEEMGEIIGNATS